LTALVFAATYAVIAIGRLPGTRLTRTGAALAGGALMLLTGAIGPVDAFRAIDLRTIALLFLMMLAAAPLRLAGVFAWLVRALSDRVKHPAALLVALIVSAGVLSAIFVNDTICVVFTPVVLELAALRGHRPMAYLLGLATATNIGSVATILGNPQNMLIGSLSRVGFWRFTSALAPIAAAGFAIDAAVIWLLFRHELHRRPADDRELDRAALPPRRAITLQSLASAIDWDLLMLFVGLFVVVGAAERAGIDRWIFETLRPIGVGTVARLTASAAVLSNIVSNVPAVMLLRTVVGSFPDAHAGWLALAMASTLAGNLTITGSVANIIVVERAAAERITVGYREFARVGVPLTLATLVIG